MPIRDSRPSHVRDGHARIPSPGHARAAVRLANLIFVLLALLVTAAPPIRADEESGELPAAEADAAPGEVLHPNNIVGLNLARRRQPDYVWAAGELANANGGAWGYVTVVWTADDRDLPLGDMLLQQFLDRCYQFRLQPIIRVATRFNERTRTWTKPDMDDAWRWRTFLERGNWPTRRVWVIPANEPNLGREWGGAVDAAEYARYLDRFLAVFADSDRFKVVNAPLDISNDTDLPRMQDAFEFLEEMRTEVPDIFERLPAWASNPYRAPSANGGLRYTHLAYEAELEYIGRDLPVIITEAGYIHPPSDEAVAEFFVEAFRDWQADPRVVAATPLFWHPDDGGDWLFELDRNGNLRRTSPTYDRLLRLPRVAGSPQFAPVLGNIPRLSETVRAAVLAAPVSNPGSGGVYAAVDGESPGVDGSSSSQASRRGSAARR